MQDLNSILFQIIVLFFSVVIHEVAHGGAALALGDDTAKKSGRLTLNPVSHIDPFGSIIFPMLLLLSSGGRLFFGWARPVPFNPYRFKNRRLGTILVAAAGPLINLLTALIFGILMNFFSANNVIVSALIPIVMINIVLAIFNLVPLFPLDGSKIFFPIFFSNWEEIEYKFGRYSLILVLFFVLYGFQYLYPVILFLANLFTLGIISFH